MQPATSKHHICVLGLGYIGLPTASLFATNGFQVTGVDVNPYVVKTINQGDIHIEEPGLKTVVQAAIKSGQLRAQTEPCEADTFIIAVPTPIDGEKHADMTYVRAAAEALLPFLRPGNLVVLESTSPPGTTRDLLVPMLVASGLEVGRDLFVAHCPERVLPGKILQELLENHRVVGGATPACAARAASLYQAIVSGEIHVTEATTAETVKVMENTYRDVNIALANELSLIAERLRINAWDVIRLANLHPRVNIHQPGPGVGGHCISVDPWFIVEQAPDQARLIHLARQINDGMPHHVMDLVTRALGGREQARVAVLGVAYKGNVDDTRESPALEIVHMLREAGHQVTIYDPHVRALEFELSDIESAFAQADCVLLLTPHNEYKYLNPAEIKKLVRGHLLVDTRNFLDAQAWRAAGFQVVTLGDAPGRVAVAADLG